MRTVDVHLPEMLQLGWCVEGPCELPWFPAAADEAEIRLVARSPILYVDPVACTMLAAWANQRALAGRPLHIDDTVKSPYLWRIGLLSALAGRAQSVDTATDRVLKVLNIRNQNGIEPILERVRRLLHLDHDTSRAIAYCLSELLRNVFEHSESEIGAFVAAGYFPSTGRVTVSVTDLGITVPAHIKRQFGDGIDDDVALALALEPRTSGSFDRDRNAGLGLYMTRRIADLTGGKFWLLTGSFCARNDGDPSSLGARAAVGIGPVKNRWRGTAVAFTLYPNRLGSFEATQRSVSRALLGAPVAHTPGLFRRKEIPQGSTVVRIPPDVSNIAQNKVAAARIRDDSIVPALHSGHRVTLDFHGVALTTQSFMHALLAAPLRLVGAPDLPSRICFRACSDQVREIIRLVMGYVLEPPSEEDDDIAAERGID